MGMQVDAQIENVLFNGQHCQICAFIHMIIFKGKRGKEVRPNPFMLSFPAFNSEVLFL